MKLETRSQGSPRHVRRMAAHGATRWAVVLGMASIFPSVVHAQDWTAMINQRMNATHQMLAQGEQQIEGMVQQRMQDPAVQRAYQQHLARAAATGQVPTDLHTFTYNYIYTNGFSAAGMAQARATEAGNQAREQQAWQGVRDAEQDRAAAMQDQRDGYFRNQQESGRQLMGNSTYQAGGAQVVLPHTWQANTTHEYQGNTYRVDPAGQYWVAGADGYWYPLSR